MNKTLIILLVLFISHNSFSQSKRIIKRTVNDINTSSNDCLFSKFELSSNGSGNIFNSTIKILSEDQIATPDKIIFPIVGIDFCINEENQTLVIKSRDNTRQFISIQDYGNYKEIEVFCSEGKLICDLVTLFSTLKSQFDDHNNCSDCK